MKTNVGAVVTVLRKSYGKVTAETRAVVSVTAFSRVRAHAFCNFISPLFWIHKLTIFCICAKNNSNTVKII